MSKRIVLATYKYNYMKMNKGYWNTRKGETFTDTWFTDMDKKCVASRNFPLRKSVFYLTKKDNMDVYILVEKKGVDSNGYTVADQSIMFASG